jgi:hypothetical protein
MGNRFKSFINAMEKRERKERKSCRPMRIPPFVKHEIGPTGWLPDRYLGMDSGCVCDYKSIRQHHYFSVNLCSSTPLSF